MASSSLDPFCLTRMIFSKRSAQSHLSVRLIRLCKRPCQIDPSAACSVTSAQIEQCYNRNQRGVMEFYTAKYTYRLDFSGKIFSSQNYDTKGVQSVLMTLCFIRFLTSDAADKCNHRKAAANQTLPPLCNWLQVKFHWTLFPPTKTRQKRQQDEAVNKSVMLEMKGQGSDDCQETLM